MSWAFTYLPSSEAHVGKVTLKHTLFQHLGLGDINVL